ncbi:uncharacterized protein ANIA_11442 [Aspergillus nidulans FGSC A4]|uniref:Uncharacterized protein n=1 Tax=Emericella nidulans (strain FGSC A4 / ATCC 38163 / CBS 112.46 / NRRL 194 / M139) TaxID=227321 RepID=C8V8A0_EMENI|nr:hypothetical protein [Aspergillus nidulans FGSC A4]CBF77320.1 TPA: hypothetical protein ANIA_11442 [Aspergillus nidulans FGSC A4]
MVGGAWCAPRPCSHVFRTVLAGYAPDDTRTQSSCAFSSTSFQSIREEDELGANPAPKDGITWAVASSPSSGE